MATLNRAKLAEGCFYKDVSCTPLTEFTAPSVTITNCTGGLSMENTMVITKTERQFEIEEEIKELRGQIDALEAEYDEERLTAEAQYEANKRYIKFEALVEAGFSEEQAFSMIDKI